jgi:hypothetical protein
VVEAPSIHPNPASNRAAAYCFALASVVASSDASVSSRMFTRSEPSPHTNFSSDADRGSRCASRNVRASPSNSSIEITIRAYEVTVMRTIRSDPARNPPESTSSERR